MVAGEQERSLPPIAEIAIATVVLVVIGGTFIAGHIPEDVPLLFPAVLMVAGYALLVANIYLLSRIHEFAWSTFRMVFMASLGGYGVIAGLLVYVFVRDDIPNDVMAFMAAMLLLFAINIPLLFGFSVARYQPAD